MSVSRPIFPGPRGLSTGLAVSALFLWLAFRPVDWGELHRALAGTDARWLAPFLAMVGLSHWLRALRWRYLLAPVARVGTGPLFAALLVGYAANAVLPAHLGEFLRAHAVGRKTGRHTAAIVSSILVERLIDLISLAGLMAVAFFIFPFPEWAHRGGKILLALTAAGVCGLALAKACRRRLSHAPAVFTGRLPAAWRTRAGRALAAFTDGLKPLNRPGHYGWVAALTAGIWLCYAGTFQILFYAFGYAGTYGIPWFGALVALVVTTLGIVLPSSPGYVGTYHYFCRISLAFFGIPPGPALAYALAMHALTLLPVVAAGAALYFTSTLSSGRPAPWSVAAGDRPPKRSVP